MRKLLASLVILTSSVAQAQTPVVGVNGGPEGSVNVINNDRLTARDEGRFPWSTKSCSVSDTFSQPISFLDGITVKGGISVSSGGESVQGDTNFSGNVYIDYTHTLFPHHGIAESDYCGGGTLNCISNLDQNFGVATWSPDNGIAGKTGNVIVGPTTFTNNAVASGASCGGTTCPITVGPGCTGVGTGDGSCDIANNSSDSIGEIWITGGTGASSSGQFVFTFVQKWPAAQNCQLTMVNHAASWDARATVRIDHSADPSVTDVSKIIVKWDNNGVNLSDVGLGPGYGISYHCFAWP
jgi:hypothetical protein